MENQKTILFLAANPSDTTRLKLEEEEKEIRKGLDQSTHRDNFRFDRIGAVTLDEMLDRIMDLKPQIVHFSGHGSGSGGLVMEDGSGQPCLVKAESLSRIFREFADCVECVVLNACFSEVQANAIAQHIPYTIGMSQAISDRAAIKFAVGFYKALGGGKDFMGAFRLACTRIAISDIPEDLTPVLIPRSRLPGQRRNPDGDQDWPNMPENNRKFVLEDKKKDSENTPQTPQFPPLSPGELIPGEGAVDLNSRLYVRSALEDRACNVISQPGALLRIKAPLGMGKSSLTIRVMACAQSHGHRTVTVDFNKINRQFFEDLDRFSQWFCASVGKALGVRVKVAELWDDIFGSNDNCTDYFQAHVLTGSPLTLALDNFDRIFDYPDIEADFCGLLRGWHEKAKSDPQWSQLRLIIVYSQESYIPKDINQSPFNVGVPIELGPWAMEQIVELASRYGLTLTPDEQEGLMAITGGHPQLVRLTLYPLASRDMTLDQVMATAATEAGLYRSHLLERLNYLEAHPELKAAMQQVVTSSEPVRLKSQDAYRLHSMGLIRRHNNDVMPLCDVYRAYFRERLTP